MSGLHGYFSPWTPVMIQSPTLSTHLAFRSSDEHAILVWIYYNAGRMQRVRMFAVEPLVRDLDGLDHDGLLAELGHEGVYTLEAGGESIGVNCQ